MDFFPHQASLIFFLAQNDVIAKVISSYLCFFWLNMFFSLADNDADVSKTHLDKAEQVIKLDFYLRLQNLENFALSSTSNKIHL